MSSDSIFQEEAIKDDVPKCMVFFSEWRRCASSSNQFHQYYIYGKFADCSVYSGHLKTCIGYKANKDEDSRQILLNAVKEKERKLTERPSESVWNFRDDPAKDWKTKGDSSS